MTRVEIKVTLPDGRKLALIEQAPAEKLSPAQLLGRAAEDAKRVLAVELAR